MSRLLLTLCLAALLPACTGLTAFEDAPAWRDWSRDLGGIVGATDPAGEQLRAEAALARVAEGDRFSVQVLRTGKPGAWAWHDGTLFVSRGLLRVMDDAELSAALAHELAHLSEGEAGERLGRVESEVRADAMGSALLGQRGYDAGAMLGMLEKLADHSDAPLRARIQRRIQRLEPERITLADARPVD